MKKFTKILLLCFTVTAGILLFQAQSYNGYNFEDDNNPLIDKPTREAFLHYHAMQNDGEMDVITDAQGFDNYDAGISFAEQHITVNPLNPLQMFFGVNGASAPQDAYNTSNGGLNWT